MLNSYWMQPYLQFVLLLLGDFSEQFGFLSGESLNQWVTLCHEASFKLHTVLLKQKTPPDLDPCLKQNMQKSTWIDHLVCVALGNRDSK